MAPGVDVVEPVERVDSADLVDSVDSVETCGVVAVFWVAPVTWPSDSVTVACGEVCAVLSPLPSPLRLPPVAGDLTEPVPPPVPTPLSPRPLVSKSSMPGRCGPSPSKGSFGKCRSGSDGRWMSGAWTSVCSPPPNLRLPPPPPIAPMMPEVSAEPMSFSPPKISDITSVVTMLDAPPMRPLPISEDANFGAKAEPAPEKIPPIAPPIAPPSRAWSVAAVSHLVRSPLRNWIPWITASMPTMKPTPVAIEISSRFSSILTIARTPVTRTGIASGAQKASSAISTASHTS
ncbi:hypothetical protein CQW39_28330 [Streptomyces griseofuscus]|nr:hypothetical protein CQW39_28330 [Streptomyces griseofuscus]